MLKVLVLQNFHGLRDVATEEHIFYRTRFKAFLGLRIGDVIPDAETLWDCNQRIEEYGREAGASSLTPSARSSKTKASSPAKAVPRLREQPSLRRTAQ
jgi:hypothetical protein